MVLYYSDDIVFTCSQVLARHPGSHDASGSIERLILSLTERDQYDAVNVLLTKLKLPLFCGEFVVSEAQQFLCTDCTVLTYCIISTGISAKMPSRVMKAVIVNSVSQNLVRSDDISNKVGYYIKLINFMMPPSFTCFFIENIPFITFNLFC